MRSTPNVLTTELRDLQYNECIDNMYCRHSFFQHWWKSRKTFSGMQEKIIIIHLKLRFIHQIYDMHFQFQNHDFET